MTKHNKAVIFIILSALSFSLMQVFVKISGPEIPVFEKIFMRNLLIFFGVLGILKKQGRKIHVPKEARWTLLARCLAGFTGVASYFYATQKMLIADASAIQQSSPIFVVILSALFLSEELTRDKILAVALGFLGVLLVVKPSFDSAAGPAMVGLIGSIASGLAYVFISKLKGRVEGEIIILAFAGFSCIASLPFFMGSFVLPKGLTLVFLLAIGVFGGLGQYFVTHGYSLAKAGEISIYSYSGIIFANILGILFFNESPDIFSLLGMLVIIVAGYLLFKLRQVET